MLGAHAQVAKFSQIVRWSDGTSPNTYLAGIGDGKPNNADPIASLGAYLRGVNNKGCKVFQWNLVDFAQSEIT